MWARDHGIGRVRLISLGDAQFRCGGSKEYVDWMERLLGLSDDGPAAATWRTPTGREPGAFSFKVVDDPEALEDRLRAHVMKGDTARLLASYGRKWVTKKRHATACASA